MLVKLPVSRITVNTDRLLFIGQKDLNQFVIVFAGSQHAPLIDGVDRDVLEDCMGVARPDRPKVEEVKPQIAVVS